MNRFDGDRYYGEIMNKKIEKREIRFLAACAALPIIGYVVLSNLYGIIIEVLGIRHFIASDTLANECFSLVVTILVILPPFLCALPFVKKKTDADILPLDRPQSTLMMLLSVPAGVAFCLIGSVVTSWISIIFSSFGATLTQPSIAAPPTGYALLVYVLRLTVSAAVMEEICFRGIIMQPLRKYGNYFAIIMSSLLFAVMHGNFVQAPAAFVSGLAIGYFTIATGTIWTGVLIHLLNNTIVAVAQYFLTSGNEDAAYLVSGTVSEIIMLVGIVCFIIFVLRRKTLKLDGAQKHTSLSGGGKFATYILNPAMIIMLAIMFYVMMGFIE